MAAFNKFQDFVEQLGKGVHQLHAAGHMLKVFLTNEQPLATDTVKADMAEISAGNGYTAGGEDSQNDYTETGGTGTCTGVDITWTAVGGTIGPFRYAVLYNDTPTSPADPLVGWWDYASNLTLQIGESFKVDFGASMFTIG
jgi:hypothetical protein